MPRRNFLSPPLPELFADLEKLKAHDSLQDRPEPAQARWKLNEKDDAVFALVVPAKHPFEWGRAELPEKSFLQPGRYPRPLDAISDEVVRVVERHNMDVKLRAWSVVSLSNWHWEVRLIIRRPNPRELRRLKKNWWE
ncbi:hypothetical protein LVJ94_34620 [Pendulispora rubella]|uniref:Uncharacterized protein n=1 Tax=Pendulispora rubella TaxID=2741070 RepID=A0ABZ2KTP3_9BACT